MKSCEFMKESIEADKFVRKVQLAKAEFDSGNFAHAKAHVYLAWSMWFNMHDDDHNDPDVIAASTICKELRKKVGLQKRPDLDYSPMEEDSGCGGMGVGAVATGPSAGARSKTGTLFGGSYKQR